MKRYQLRPAVDYVDLMHMPLRRRKKAVRFLRTHGWTWNLLTQRYELSPPGWMRIAAVLLGSDLQLLRRA